MCLPASCSATLLVGLASRLVVGGWFLGLDDQLVSSVWVELAWFLAWCGLVLLRSDWCVK
jgi:hypothetical protein